MQTYSKALMLAALTLGSVAGCATETSEEEEVGEAEGAYSGSRSVSLKYEGTCEFLRTCSKYSRNLPAGKVSWGCTGVGACDDDALWVAGPNRSYCGKTVQICKGSRCANARVKDVSVSRDWEASNGVLDAIGLPYGLTGRCSGYGGGKVTVSVNSSGSGGSNDDDPVTPTTPADDDRDDGCFSATLGIDVPELTCVQARSNRLYYQCKNGKWYRGVSGDDGPYGRCLEVHPL